MGSTIEVDALYRHFRAGLPADRFVAVTNPGTPLETLARAEGFRAVFNNPGERAGASRRCGCTQASCPRRSWAWIWTPSWPRPSPMRALCGPDTTLDQNPGVYLGTFLGEAERARRDKLTLLIDPSLSALGT